MSQSIKRRVALEGMQARTPRFIGCTQKWRKRNYLRHPANTGLYHGSHMTGIVAQQVLRKVKLPALTLLLCVAANVPAQRPPSPTVSVGTLVPVSIDALRLDDVLTLHSPFLAQGADDPRFADPGFDDSAWTPLKPNQSLVGVHITTSAKSYIWFRIHLSILHANGPLAIAIGHLGYPYSVYANGQQVASSAGMAMHDLLQDPPFPISLPEVQDVTLAIRFYHPRVLTRSPLKLLKIGHRSSVAAATELARIHDFDTNDAFQTVLSMVLYAFGFFSLVLYVAQRQRSEYLWLALYCVFKGAYAEGWRQMG